MPNLNGVELAKAINNEHKKFPIVLITGFADQVETKLFSDVLIKPFKIKELIDISKKHL